MRNNLKKFILIQLIISLIMIPLPVHSVETDVLANSHVIRDVVVAIDGNAITYNDFYGKPFIDENNRTQVPLRLTMEIFGAEVLWDKATYSAIVKKNNIEVIVPIGKNYILRNGKKIENDTKAIAINSRTYLPIRVVLEAFGSEVIWDQQNYKVIVKTYDQLPHKFDLRKVGRVTAVKDQKDLGTCWAFASIGAIESILTKEQVYDFSEDNVSLTHGYNLSQDDGGDIKLALTYFARWSGPILEKDDIYGDGIANNNAKAVKHLQEAYMIPSKNYNLIKEAIIKHGGVHTSIYLDYIVRLENDNYYKSETNSLNYTGNKPTNHDVVIVGWDDQYPKENFANIPEGDGAFLAKNSFGKSFGDNGYFYISYYDKHVGDYNIVYNGLESNDNYDKIYQSDWLGWLGRLGYEQDTAYFSNIYATGEKKEILEAVSFYATDINTDYEVYVVDDFNSVDDFNKMQLMEVGTKKYKGYYTINLSNPIILNENTKFAVIVKVKTPGSKFPIAAEYYSDVEWLDKVDISDGEGYMSFNGKVWEDTEETLSANVCLKAFTSIKESEPPINNRELSENIQ